VTHLTDAASDFSEKTNNNRNLHSTLIYLFFLFNLFVKQNAIRIWLPIAVLYSNYGSISCRFRDIQCWKMSWPWNWGQRPLQGIKSGIIR